MDEAEFRKSHLEELRQDRIRGAGQLGRRCLEILAEFAGECDAAGPKELHLKLNKLGRELQATRPSMAPVQNLVERCLLALEQRPANSLLEARQQASEHAHALMEQSLRAVTEISNHVAELIGPDQTLITHSLSSTMLAVFRRVAASGIHTIVTESRPLLEGRTLAGHLSKLGIAATYITDAQIGVFMREATLAMVGADSVLGDGSAVNKAGTYLLALAANDQNVPFYVCCESFKFTQALADAITLEEMDATELRPIDLAHVTPRNVYFDVTPSRLITGWVTEDGIFESFPPETRG